MNAVILAVVALQYLGSTQADFFKRDWIVDKGDHQILCSQEPMEFSIVLDSSSSILDDDFEKAKMFLVKFLQQFQLGTGKDDVRVSIITFGDGVYPQDSFNLTTYETKDEILNAISEVPHRGEPYTATGPGIRFMHYHQMVPGVVRPEAEKIALVITDGNSQRWHETRDEALSARKDNITIFALGIGSEKQVQMKELVRIGGDLDHVTRVESFDDLNAIRQLLAKKTCIRKEKTTTPMPQTTCGEMNPADINFIFSPSDLGIDGSNWAKEFVRNIITQTDMKQGFRYGVKTGSCPDDEGFELEAYETVGEIEEHLEEYGTIKLPSLISYDLFDEFVGGRPEARKVAVIFMSGVKGLKGGDLQERVNELVSNGVEVFLANPMGFPMQLPGATSLKGRSSRRQSEMVKNFLCPN